MGTKVLLNPTQLKQLLARSLGDGFVIKPPRIDQSILERAAGVDPGLNNGAPTLSGICAYPDADTVPGAGAGLGQFSADAAPGYIVRLSGHNFGNDQGEGYVRLTDNGHSWGGPGDPSALPIRSWSTEWIDFVLPNSSADQSFLQANSYATVIPVNKFGLAGNPAHLQVIEPPEINSLSPYKAGPGDLITITGQSFGTQQGCGYKVELDNKGATWIAKSTGGFQVPRKKGQGVT